MTEQELSILKRQYGACSECQSADVTYDKTDAEIFVVECHKCGAITYVMSLDAWDRLSTPRHWFND